jgi:hypothetical protein
MADEQPSNNFNTNERYITSPAIMQQQDIAKYMLSAHKGMIEEIALLLNGQEKQDGRNIITMGEKEMNQEGIKQVVQTLKMSMGANIFLSVFTIDDILDQCRDMEYELNQQFTENWKSWKMKPEKIPILIRLIMGQIHAALNRAREFNKEYGAFGGTTQAFTQTQQTHEVISREKKGGFSFPNILGGHKNE